jgi:hypothetical protein
MSTEKAETSEDEPQPKLGQLDTSEEAVPVIHLLLRVRPVKASRLVFPSKESAQVNPLKSKPP